MTSTQVPIRRGFANPAIDDRSGGGAAFRALVRDLDGYQAFRRALKPRWPQVWADLAVTWLLVVAVAVLTAWLQRRLTGSWAIAVIPLSAALIGVGIQRIGLFIHEGAHFNVAPGRRLNDALTNLFSAGMILADVRSYRPCHLAHHRFLGTTSDTEASYFNPIGLRFVLQGLTGGLVLETLRRRASGRESESAKVWPWVQALGLGAHLTVIVAAAATGSWWLALAWLVGAFSVFPMLGALRQALEHRSDVADADTNYRVVDHGAFTRMFTGSVFGTVLGGVGFNRHLLHHWEPGISYTRLRDLETFLRHSDAAPIVDARVTTYSIATRRLWTR